MSILKNRTFPVTGLAVAIPATLIPLFFLGSCRPPIPRSQSHESSESSLQTAAAKPAFASPDAAVRAFSASSELRAIAKPKSVASLLGNADFALLAQQQDFASLLVNPALARLAGNSDFRSLLTDPAYPALANDRAVNSAIATGTVTRLLAWVKQNPRGGDLPPSLRSNETDYLMNVGTAITQFAERPAFVSMAANRDFKALAAEPAFGSSVALHPKEFARLVTNTEFDTLLHSGDVARAAAHPAFTYLAQKQALSKMQSVLEAK